MAQWQAYLLPDPATPGSILSLFQSLGLWLYQSSRALASGEETREVVGLQPGKKVGTAFTNER